MKIVLSVILALFVIGCSDEQKEQVKKEVKAVEVKVETKTESIKEKAKDIASTVKDSTAYVVEAIVPEKIDVALLYKACAGCHGQNAEKAALGKSQIIKGWSADKIVNALNGYADGSYGGALKGMMKSQASKLDKDEKKAIAEYISKL